MPPRATEREGQSGEIAQGPQSPGGPRQLISKFSFIAPLDVFKEPPDSVPQIPLLSAISHRGPHFAVLPLGLENNSAALPPPPQFDMIWKIFLKI